MLEAEDEVAYRKKLLAGLTRVQKKWRPLSGQEERR
jgi:hypothetical protein